MDVQNIISTDTMDVQNVTSTDTMDVQNVTSTNTMDIQNIISTDSVTSSPIPVSSATDNTTTATATSSTTSSRNILAVWDNFTLLSNEPKAKCKYCKSILAHKKGTGTSHLWCHLKSCNKFKKNRTCNEQLNDLVDMIIWDKLCFQFVEKPGFHKFLSGILPCFSMSTDTVKRDIMKGYNERKNLIRTILQNAESRISLTCDMWTSLQQLGYLAITAHFLDKKWNLVSLLISFELLLPYSHTGANIRNCIKTVTDDYLITTKLQTITLDNASSNDVAIRELINSASQNLINIKKELFHNRCLAHILNLIVKDGLKEILEIRNCVKAIHTTPRRHQMFLDVCEYESIKATILPLDCETR
ncbi:5206_t:CDS:2 [Dentiscutata erythropus]|uniref:5206_t:CDS:1 n=1 Tax=Dentiscutata erythropus TaxID=1348616 RepID=A0A9N9I7D1_9GLOM|nr:5206_t:CDS:2 [Dentiscutata erythropus]